MNNPPDPTANNSTRDIPAPSRRTIFSELLLLAGIYIATVFIGSLTIAACGPGCCFVFFSILAGVSGLLMFRQSFMTRCLCFAVLLLALFGTWHEKEARDSWRTFHLRQQLKHANELLEQQHPSPQKTSTN